MTLKTQTQLAGYRHRAAVGPGVVAVAKGMEDVGELPRSFHTNKPRMIGAATTIPAIEVHVPSPRGGGLS